MAIEPKMLADGWMELRVINDDTGELEGIMELKPTYHAVYAQKIAEAQCQVRAIESSPSRGGKVLPFRRIASAVASLLLFFAA